MKILNAFIAVLFALFAAFQYNDPDGMTWVLIYGFIAVLAGFAVFGKVYPDLSLGALVLICGIALLHLPGAIEFFTNGDGIGLAQGMSNEYQYIELMREFFGLVLASLAMFGIYRSSRSISKA